MTHKTTRTARSMIAIGAAAALLSIAGGSAFAGEITGNGTLKEVHGRSSCAYSGPGGPAVLLRRREHHAARPRPPRATRAMRSRGARSTRPRAHFLTTLGLNPGIACNPNRALRRADHRSATPSAVAPPRPTASGCPAPAQRRRPGVPIRAARSRRVRPQVAIAVAAPVTIAATQAAISARRVNAELGEDVLHVGADRARRQAERGSPISLFVRPSATSRAISNSRAVERPPRLLLGAAAAGDALAARRRASGAAGCRVRSALASTSRSGSIASASRFARSRHAARSSLAQVASQVRPSAVPAGDRGLERGAGRDRGACARADQPVGVVERRPRQVVPAREERGHARRATAPRRRVGGRRAPRGRPSRRTGRGAPARPWARASSTASSQSLQRDSGSPATSAVSASPHIAGSTRSTSPAGRPIASDSLEQRACPLDIAAPEGDEPERVARAERAAPAPVLDQLDARRSRPPRPSGRRPRRGARSSPPSRGGSTTARSRRRSAGPRRRPISAAG